MADCAAAAGGVEAQGALPSANGAAHVRLRMPLSARQARQEAIADANASGSNGYEGEGLGPDGYGVGWPLLQLWRQPEGMLVIWLLAALLVGVITGATAGGAHSRRLPLLLCRCCSAAVAALSRSSAATTMAASAKRRCCPAP